jgi:hypothetical protein
VATGPGAAREKIAEVSGADRPAFEVEPAG